MLFIYLLAVAATAAAAAQSNFSGRIPVVHIIPSSQDVINMSVHSFPFDDNRSFPCKDVNRDDTSLIIPSLNISFFFLFVPPFFGPPSLPLPPLPFGLFEGLDGLFGASPPVFSRAPLFLDVSPSFFASLSSFSCLPPTWELTTEDESLVMNGLFGIPVVFWGGYTMNLWLFYLWFSMVLSILCMVRVIFSLEIVKRFFGYVLRRLLWILKTLLR